MLFPSELIAPLQRQHPLPVNTIMRIVTLQYLNHPDERSRRRPLLVGYAQFVGTQNYDRSGRMRDNVMPPSVDLRI
jgi:hypothetical protein